MSELLPDVGEAFRWWALSRPSITALVGTRISVRLAGSEPAIRYGMSGGSGGYGEGAPVVQVEAWGRGNGAPDDGIASRIARTVAAEIEGAGCRGVWGDAYCAGAGLEVYPFDSADAASERPRQILTVRMFIYPKEAAS